MTDGLSELAAIAKTVDSTLLQEVGAEDESFWIVTDGIVDESALSLDELVDWAGDVLAG